MMKNKSLETKLFYYEWVRCKSLLIIKALLKLIVDFGTLLIGVEGAKTPAGGRGRGDPAGAQRRGGFPDRPRKAKRLERKSTGMFNTAIIKKNINLINNKDR